MPTLLHLGALHPAEQVLTLLLAFGPFVLLGVTIWLSRRRAASQGGPTAAAEPGDVRREVRDDALAEPGPDPGQEPAR